MSVDIWAGEGKPYADLYLDDRAVAVRATAVDWLGADNVVRQMAQAKGRKAVSDE